jgi:hypothetical protein
MLIQNCAPHEVNIHTGDILGILSTEKDEPIPFNNDSLATICEQILHQNTDLSGKFTEEYRTPSEKLKKDPIMALVMKTVATYMFIKHNNNGKANPGTEDFSSWGEPFFKRKE